MTTWSPQQDAALCKITRWMDAPSGTVPQVLKLDGFAGTGKTTLAKALFDHASGRAIAASFTGKAASVMASKGLWNASTIHRLIYTPAGSDAEAKIAALREELKTLEAVSEPDRGTLMRAEAVRRQVRDATFEARNLKFLLKEQSDLSAYSLAIIDEHTMVDERMGSDLLSFGVKVLAIGDPAQLPPIRGTGFFMGGEPDVLLTEIHRQAADNPIIALATAVRKGRALPRGDFGRARVVGSVSKEEALAADQILCGTNARRRAINTRHRELEGRVGPMPVAGDRLVCLANDHDMGLMNGTLWDVVEDAQWEPGEDVVGLSIRPDTGGEPMLIAAEACIFLDEEDRRPFMRNQQFTYGYGLTVHKAQGSQWNSVILFDDWPARSETKRQWLYTGITRAAETLTVVLL